MDAKVEVAQGKAIADAAEEAKVRGRPCTCMHMYVPLWNDFSQTTPVGLKPIALPERANMALHTTTWVTSESNQGSGESGAAPAPN